MTHENRPGAPKLGMPASQRAGHALSGLTPRVDDAPLRDAASHHAFQVALSDALRPLAEPLEVQAEAARVLAQHLGASRVFYAEADASGEYVSIAHDYSYGVASIAGRFRLDDFGPALMTELHAGRTVVVTDVESNEAAAPELSRAQRCACMNIDVRAYVVVPLVKRHQLVAILCLHQAEPRAWTRAEIALAEDTAERTWSAVERARSEAALRQSEEKYRLLFDSIDQGFCTIDMVFDDRDRPIDYVFAEVNRAFAAQTGLDDAVGRSMRSLRPDHEEHWFEIYGRIARTGQPERFEARAAELDRWYSVYAFRIGPPADHRVAVLFDDISERKRAEALLRESDRRKDEFLATLAHELRNPLAPIHTGLELMKLVAGDPARVEAVRAKMATQTRQLMHLVDDLLDVSRINSGKFRLRKQRVELAEVVRSAVDATHEVIDAADHQLHVELPAEPVPLHADPTRLTQILSNLLTNAAKYTPSGGRIWLRAERAGGEVVVSVEDTGIGIPEHFLPKVFDMFEQLDRAEERAHGGLGIGLMLVKRLVEMHGGSVSARSDGAGRGSAFVVRLPIWDDVAADAEAPEQVAHTAPAPQREILIADDNRDAADMLSVVVEMLGHRVHVAYDGAEALKLAERVRPDVVVLDLAMPEVSGIEVARRIRDMPWGQRPVLIALTGWGQEDVRRRTRDAGFDHHLVKPVEAEALQPLLADGRRPHAPS